MLNLLFHIKNSDLNLEELAKKSGLNVDRIQGFLNESIEPTMSDIRKMSKALKLSVDFLTSDESKYADVAVLFRKAVKNDSERLKADKVSYMVGNSFKLLQNMQLEDKLLPLFPQGRENNSANARLLASMFRQIFCNGDFFSPLLHLPEIVSKELNCILFIKDLGQDIDGASAIVKSVPFIFISPRFEPRMLFTLAHELGHILAHHDRGEDFVKFDHDISAFRNSKMGDEAFANLFASELLLPEEGVGVTLKSIRSSLDLKGHIGDLEIILLSRIYGVSFEVAAHRCEALKLIPQGGARSLYEEIIKVHKSPEKRAEEANLPERPKIEFPKVSSTLINSAIRKVYAGDISLGKASELLSLSIADIIHYNAN